MRDRAVRLVAALVLVGSVGCSFIPAYTAPAEFRAARFVAADAWLFGELTLRPSLSQLANATRLANAFTNQPGWDAYTRRLSATTDADVTRLANTVLGLLDGEVAFALLGSPNASGTPRGVLLAHSSDPDRLIGVLGTTAAGALPPPRKDAHGASIYSLPGEGGLVASYQGWMVAASTRPVLDDTLGRIAGGTTTGALSDVPAFKTLLSRLPADRLGLEYVDAGALVRQTRGGRPSPAGLPPTAEAVLSEFDSQLAVAFAAVPAGLDLRLEATTRLPPGLASQAQLASEQGDPRDAFAHLPSSTLLAFGAGLPPLGPELDEVLDEVFQEYASDLGLPELSELDVHPSQWLGGSFALGGSPGSLGETSDGQPDLFLVAHVTDAEAAQADLVNVSRLLPPKSVSPISVTGAPFLQAGVGDGESLTYGVADDWLYATSGDAEALVTAAATGGLEDNPRYGTLRAALGGDQLNVFADLQGAQELANRLLDPAERVEYASAVGPVVAPLTFFGGGSRSDPNGDTHAHFVLGVRGA